MADSPPPQRNPDLRPADADLAALVTVGDRTAFSELYDRYGKPAYSLARRICVDPVLAEGVVQEAFLASGATLRSTTAHAADSARGC